MENNQFALIATMHYAKSDPGYVVISASTVIIDKTFGKFIEMDGQIGHDEPKYQTGGCRKERT